MSNVVDNLTKRMWHYCAGVLCLSLLSPALLSADEAGSQPPSFDWQAENYEINTPLGGLTGVPERGRVIAGDPLRGNCLACHQLPIPEEDFHGNLGPPLAGIASRQSTGMIRLHIVDQSRFNPETVMPGYYRPFGQLHRVAAEYQGRTYLSAQEIEDVVAYLATLK